MQPLAGRQRRHTLAWPSGRSAAAVHIRRDAVSPRTVVAVPSRWRVQSAAAMADEETARSAARRARRLAVAVPSGHRAVPPLERHSWDAVPHAAAPAVQPHREAAWSMLAGPKHCSRSGCASLCLGRARCPACCHGSERPPRRHQTRRSPPACRCGHGECGSSQNRQSRGSAARESGRLDRGAAQAGRAWATGRQPWRSCSV